MSTLRYKDFQGSVDFEEGVLVIRILHIDDLITAEIDSAALAQSAFEELVDDYLDTCKELGKEPCKPFKGSFNVRVPPELHRQVVMSAAEVGESMNSWIAVALQSRVERQKAKKLMLDRNFVARILYREEEILRQTYTRMETLQRHGEVRTLEAVFPRFPRPFQRQSVN